MILRRKYKNYLLLFILIFVGGLIPAKVKAEAYVLNADPTEDGYTVEVDMSTFEGTVTITTEDGMKNWLGYNGSNAGTSMYGSLVKKLIVSSQVTWMDGRAVAGLPKLEEIEVDSDNTKYKSVDNVIYSKDGKRLIAYPRSLDSTFTVPDTVTELGSYLFYGNKEITEVNLPDSVTEIGDHAFRECTNLTKVTAKDITWIQSWAFWKCSKLTDIELNSLYGLNQDAFNSCTKLKNFTITEADSLKSVGPSALEDCASLEQFPYLSGATDFMNGVFSGCTSLKEITLPANLDEIEVMTFYNCESLESITIPATVTRIGASVFENCQTLGKIVFLSDTPPVISSDSFKGVPASVLIDVPEGTEENYIAVFGEAYRDNILQTGAVKYDLFVNGYQIRSDRLTINCGDGTATYNPDKKLLVLQNATITGGVGEDEGYGYGGSINSAIDDLTIQIVGNNSIDSAYDGISSNRNCNVKLIGDGTLDINTSTELDPYASSVYVGMGSWPNGATGDFVVDGPTLTANRQIVACHDVIIKNSTVTTPGRLNSNQAGTILVADDSKVTVGSISMGVPTDSIEGSVYSSNMTLALYSGELKLTNGGVYFLDNDDNNDDDRGHIYIAGGHIVIDKIADEGKKIADCPKEQIYIADGFGLSVDDFLKGGVDKTSTVADAPENVDSIFVVVDDITISEISGELEIGDSKELSVVVEPDNATYPTVTWESSDSEIATVDENGVVNAVSGGAVQIIATADRKKAVFNLTVNGTGVIKVTSIELDKTECELPINDSILLTPTVKPDLATNKTVMWASADKTIATVDSKGNVTAVSKGTTKIIAKAGSMEAECIITVIVPVSNITLNNTSLDLTVGESTSLKATVLPENATYEAITWNSDKPGVATVDTNGKVTAVAAGNAKITALVDGKSAVCNVTVKAASSTDPGNVSGGGTSTDPGNVSGGGTTTDPGNGSGGGTTTDPGTGSDPGTSKDTDTSSDSLTVVEPKIVALDSEKDAVGSEFSGLQAKASKVTKNSVKLSWKKVSGASKYIVYGNTCGKSKKCNKLGEVKSTSFTLKKLDGKALKKGTYYKFVVVAVDSKDKVISISKMVHAATSGGKVGNVKKITTKAKKNKVTVKTKKQFKLAAKQVAKSKKLKVKNHRKLSYESTNASVATVNAKGVIKGISKGSCYVYVYSQDGVNVKIKVTVK